MLASLGDGYNCYPPQALKDEIPIPKCIFVST